MFAVGVVPLEGVLLGFPVVGGLVARMGPYVLFPLSWMSSEIDEAVANLFAGVECFDFSELVVLVVGILEDAAVGELFFLEEVAGEFPGVGSCRLVETDGPVRGVDGEGCVVRSELRAEVAEVVSAAGLGAGGVVHPPDGGEEFARLGIELEGGAAAVVDVEDPSLEVGAVLGDEFLAAVVGADRFPELVAILTSFFEMRCTSMGRNVGASEDDVLCAAGDEVGVVEGELAGEWTDDPVDQERGAAGEGGDLFRGGGEGLFDGLTGTEGRECEGEEEPESHRGNSVQEWRWIVGKYWVLCEKFFSLDCSDLLRSPYNN